MPREKNFINTFWQRTIEACVNTDLIRMQQESQEPAIPNMPGKVDMLIWHGGS